MLEQLGLIGTIRDEDPIPDEAETESEQEVSRIRDQSPSAGIGVVIFGEVQRLAVISCGLSRRTNII